MEPLQLRKVGLYALTMAVLTLLVLGAFGYRDWAQFRKASILTVHTRRILTLNESLLSRMRDAETGQRGFLLTGRQEYLEPYNAATGESISGLFRELVDLTSDEPDQGNRVRQLRLLIDQKAAELRQTIELRKSNGLGAALEVVQSDEGKRTMDQIRSLSREIQAAENERWLAAWTALQNEAQDVRILNLVGVSLLVSLVVLGGGALRGSAAQRDQLIAELSLAKETIEENLELQRATLYGIGDAVIRTDRDGLVRMMNPVAEHLTGFKEEAANGQGVEQVFRIVNENTRNIVESPVGRVLREGVVVGLANHTVLLARSGREIPIDDSGAPIRGRDGAIKGVVLVFRDVSERKRAEEVVGRLGALVENSDDAIVGKTLQGIITSWNPAAEAIFGYSASEMIGNSIRQLIPPGSSDDFTKILEQIGRGEQVKNYETERLTKDGRRINVSLTVSPIRDESGHIVGASKIARDITEKRRLEERLRLAQRMEAIGQMAGGVAHDFNNLLTVIDGYSSLALRRLGEEHPVHQHLVQISAAGERAAALTQQLLAFSRKQVLQPKIFDINGLIEQTKPLLTRLIREDIEFVTNLDPSVSPIEADPHQIDQVLMNLVINASDAMPHGGKIAIETGNVIMDEQDTRQRLELAPGPYVILAVSDTGIGMDPGIQSRVFEPFFTTKAPGKGTGLGLSTVYGIVKQSGGYIGVYSEPGVGTTFRVYLPAATAPLVPELDRIEVTSFQGTETILVVEDDPNLRAYVVNVLKDLGYSTMEASDGKQALAVAQGPKDGIDLLITDVVMPKMSGRELAQALAPRFPRMRVLFMSGYTENAIVQRGVLNPGLEFLPKPFRPNELAKKVREVLLAPLRAKSILLVDDDDAIRQLLATTLREAGYEVTAISQGTEVVSVCKRKPVDLLITDMVMPNRQGAEVIRDLRKEVPHVHIIAMSGSLDPQSLKSAQDNGAQAALRKPFKSSELLDAVRRLIG